MYAVEAGTSLALLLLLAGPLLTLGARAQAPAPGLASASSKAAAAVAVGQAKAERAKDEQLALASSEQRRLLAAPLVDGRESVRKQASSISVVERRLAASPSSLAGAVELANGQDLEPAAGGHYGGGGKGHSKYYMYAESPKKGAYKAGFKRGNHKHMIMRKEAQHKSHAHGYMKWHDKKGKGSHKWEYKHSKGKHHYYG